MPLKWTQDWPVWVANGTEGNDVVTVATDGAPVTNDNRVFLRGGNDYADLQFGTDGGWGGTGNDTILGNWGNDTLIGEEDNDVLYGGDDEDRLYGGTGADALFGGAGNDFLDGDLADNAWDNLGGGNGHDTYVIWESYDVISGESAFATSTSRDLIHLKAAAYNMNESVDTRAIENLTIMNKTGATVTGNMLANTILGDDGVDVINGDAGNDLIKGGKGTDSLTGSIGNDTLHGEDGADWIAGSAGSDRIFGGNNWDNLYGGDQADTIWGGGGVDSIYGGSADDFIYGDDAEAGDDVIYGGSGNDIVFGGDGSDQIYGGEGNDTIFADKGQYDRLRGGAGDDRYYLTDITQMVREEADEGFDTVLTTFATASLGSYNEVEAMFFAGAAVAVDFVGTSLADVLSIKGAASGRVQGFDGDDDLTGSDGNDMLSGGGGNDLIRGLGGHDSIYGDGGDDELRGGAGNDTYFSVDVNDLIVEDANGGRDTIVTSAINVEMADNVEVLVSQAYAPHYIRGNASDNLIADSGTNGRIYGQGGHDDISGRGGYDSLYGEIGNDTLSGGDLDDQLYGGTGNDTLSGGSGNDFLNGGSGDDLMQGGIGDDTYFVDSLGDKVVESIFANGVDTVRTTLSSFTLASDVENLIYWGDSNFTGTGSGAANRIEGGRANDTIRGNGGNDVIDGNGGTDLIWGGAGADRFIFNNDNGTKSNARIHDFAGGVDKLILDSDAGWSASFVDSDTTRYVSATGGTVVVDGLDIGHIWNSVEFV